MYPSQAEGENSFGWVAVAVPNTEWAIGNKYIYTLDMSYGCGKVDPVDPNPDGGGTVKPGDKDPGKGENVFGEVIKFKVEVKDWNKTDNEYSINGTTGNVVPNTNVPAKKK